MKTHKSKVLPIIWMNMVKRKKENKSKSLAIFVSIKTFKNSRSSFLNLIFLILFDQNVYLYKYLTLASKACLNISQSVLAYLSDLPVSVAYKIIHLILLANALPINLAENFTALQRKYFIYLIKHHIT